MSKVQRIVLTGFAMAVALIAVAFGAVYTLSEAAIRRVYDTPARPLTVDHSTIAVARGKRLAALLGCTATCHAADLTGSYVNDDPAYPIIHATNLSLRLRDYSDPEIARAVREGVDRDGRPLWDMPAYGFETLSDRDMADVIAFLRTFPPKGEPKPKPRFGWRIRWDIARGDYEAIPALVRQARAKPAADLGPQFADARYLVRIACTECHQSDLRGEQPPVAGRAPDLMIAATYDLDGFRQLLRTGVAADGKERGLMTYVARHRFVNFTDEEITKIHAYLTARAAQAP